MYKVLEDIVPQTAAKMNVLSVSGSQSLAKVILNDRQDCFIENIEYPEYDVCDLSFQDDTFDVVVCDQVIEHVENPQVAIQNMSRVLKPGGLMVVTSCFVNLYHPAPNDYWRFTEQAYALMCKNCDNLKLIKTGKSGNLLQTLFFTLGFRKQKIPYSSIHPLTYISQLTSERYYVTSWFIAEKKNNV